LVSVDIGNLRYRPALDAAVVGKVKRGDALTAWRAKGDWFMVTTADHRAGWVHRVLFKGGRRPVPPAHAATSPRTSRKTVYLRVQPDLNRDPTDRLEAGAAALTIGERDEWFLVLSENDGVGWSQKEDFLGPGGHRADPMVSTVRKTDESRIAAPETTEPAPPSPRIPASVKQATLKVTVGRVREAPSLDAPILFRLVEGEGVSVTRIQGEWYRIRLEDGRAGWAHQSLFGDPGGVAMPEAGVTPEITALQFVQTPEGAEAISIQLNGYFPPETYSNTVDGPKLICEFSNARMGPNLARHYPVNGKFVSQIRIGTVQGTQSKIKVVADLVPQKKYGIRPVFFKAENLFSLIVQAVE
jgi:SH3-like domain-containing protein